VVEELDHLHNEEDEHGEQQNYLRSNLEPSREEFDSQRASTQGLRDELTTLQEERDFFSKRAEDLSLELHDKSSEVEYLAAEKAIQDEEISLLHLKLDEYKREVDSLEDQLDIATNDGDVSDLPILYQELEIMESKNAKLERELAAVKVRVETLTKACELVS
jgi:predicted  nucleic acid-binding Zn-ribbon protein